MGGTFISYTTQFSSAASVRKVKFLLGVREEAETGPGDETVYSWDEIITT